MCVGPRRLPENEPARPGAGADDSTRQPEGGRTERTTLAKLQTGQDG